LKEERLEMHSTPQISLSSQVLSSMILKEKEKKYHLYTGKKFKGKKKTTKVTW